MHITAVRPTLRCSFPATKHAVVERKLVLTSGRIDDHDLHLLQGWVLGPSPARTRQLLARPSHATLCIFCSRSRSLVTKTVADAPGAGAVASAWRVAAARHVDVVALDLRRVHGGTRPRLHVTPYGYTSFRSTSCSKRHWSVTVAPPPSVGPVNVGCVFAAGGTTESTNRGHIE